MGFLALVLGKMVSFFLSLMGRGSSLPGKLALDVDKNFLGRFQYPDTLIFITGTNGKTSTTNYIANILKEDGQDVLTNIEGANMAQGIATQVVNHSSLSLNIKADSMVLEVDEATMPNIIDVLNPSHIVMLNLFPDQEDRYGGVSELASLLNHSITTDSRLILNANDPRLVWIGYCHSKLRTTYYGLEETDLDLSAHVIDCPNCYTPLEYSHSHYEHIGYFKCPECGVETPNIDYLAKDLDIDYQEFKVDGQVYHLPQPNAYTLFNALAAVATCSNIGIASESIQKGLSEVATIKGRNERIALGNKEVGINLAKNAASMNQSIANLVHQQKEPYDLVLAINNHNADGISIQWLLDCDFTKLLESPLQSIYVSGTVRSDLYDILIEKGFNEDQLFTENEESAVEKLKLSDHEGYIIANYTALYELYQYLK